MNDSLKLLIEKSRAIPMNAHDREQQRRSFAYGNTHFENPLITREMVDQQAEALEKIAAQAANQKNDGT